MACDTLGIKLEDVKTPSRGVLEKLALAMFAGARAIETTKRFHGTTYVRDHFGEARELAYAEAAEMLREYGEHLLETLEETADG